MTRTRDRVRRTASERSDGRPTRHPEPGGGALPIARIRPLDALRAEAWARDEEIDWEDFDSIPDLPQVDRERGAEIHDHLVPVAGAHWGALHDTDAAHPVDVIQTEPGALGDHSACYTLSRLAPEGDPDGAAPGDGRDGARVSGIATRTSVELLAWVPHSAYVWLEGFPMEVVAETDSLMQAMADIARLVADGSVPADVAGSPPFVVATEELVPLDEYVGFAGALIGAPPPVAQLVRPLMTSGGEIVDVRRLTFLYAAEIERLAAGDDELLAALITPDRLGWLLPGRAALAP